MQFDETPFQGYFIFDVSRYAGPATQVFGYQRVETRAFLREWEPLRAALAHRPFNPDSTEYKAFRAATLNKVEELRRRYPAMPNPFNNE